jgi:FAD/FMN-containing dehydrogenase/Fe-S oxidoreductase
LEPQQRQRVRDDLKGVVRGELLFDDLSRVLYSTDASIFQVEPLGVVVPRDEEDVAAVVRYAAEHQVPLVPRGAGTGVAGESLGPGLVVDLSRHFRSILETTADTVRVQPGVVCRQLAEHLARHGRRFAPDPAAGECTVGGMLATNASGARAFRHGFTRDHVAGLRVVLDTGVACAVGRLPRFGERPPGRLGEVVTAVVALLEHNAGLIAEHRPRTRFDRCGYLLHDVLDAGALDLARLLVGTEGTLALFTEATLRVIPLPAGRAVVLLAFDSLDTALRAAQEVAATGPTACDLIDRRLLRLVRGSETGPGAATAPVVRALVPAAAEAILLVEYEADTPAAARRSADSLAAALRRERLALVAHVAAEEDEINRLWQVREAALPGLYGLRGSAQPLPFVEDVGVPPEALASYLYRVQELLQRQETTASFLVHALTGQVHMRPFLEYGRPEDAGRLWGLADEVYQIALDLGGTISAQHGTGLARTPWVPRQAGPLLRVWRDLKAAFDPHWLLNPGKIVRPPATLTGRPEVPPWPLRRQTENGAASGPDPALRWAEGEMAAEARHCNGCGSCRTEAPGLRMCPVFRATRAEAATPRAKANLLRHLLRPGGDAKLLSADDVRAVADLCVNCKMCASECPAHVNVPKLMLQAKAANVAEHGLDRHHWALARAEGFAWLGSALAPATNALLGNPVARWLVEKLLGVSRLRRLPAFAGRSFLRRAGHRRWTRKPRTDRPRVAYFVDVFANYNDPTLAEAVVAVLHHNGHEVYVPPGQRGCGMAPLAYGDVEAATETVQANLRVLADLAREGFTVLCSEPTAALMFRHDALDLVGDADARLVAGATVECTSYLWDLHRRGRLCTDFRPLPVAVGHHVPCHLKALGGPPRGPDLLALIPGLRVHTIDVSCSGMAGTFGLGAANRAVSLEAGRPMLAELARPRVLFGSTECSTCRVQMEDGAGKRTLHPVQYLALAYGLMPELARRLRTPLGRLLLQ